MCSIYPENRHHQHHAPSHPNSSSASETTITTTTLVMMTNQKKDEQGLISPTSTKSFPLVPETQDANHKLERDRSGNPCRMTTTLQQEGKEESSNTGGSGNDSSSRSPCQREERKVHFRVTQFSYVEPELILPPLPVSDLFYTKEELERINNENRAIITCLEYGGNQNWWSTTSTSKHNLLFHHNADFDYDHEEEDYHNQNNKEVVESKKQEELEQRRQQMLKQQLVHVLQHEVESPVRGLEDKTTDGLRQRYWNQHPALRAVFREQARQRQEGINDPKTLAQLYLLVSQDSRREAKRRGKNDAAIAKSAVHLMTLMMDDDESISSSVVMKEDGKTKDDKKGEQQEEGLSCPIPAVQEPPVLALNHDHDDPTQHPQEVVEDSRFYEETNRNPSTETILSVISSNNKNYQNKCDHDCEQRKETRTTPSSSPHNVSSLCLLASADHHEPLPPLSSTLSPSASPPTSSHCVYQMCDHHDGLEQDLVRIHVLPLS